MTNNGLNINMITMLRISLACIDKLGEFPANWRSKNELFNEYNSECEGPSHDPVPSSWLPPPHPHPQSQKSFPSRIDIINFTLKDLVNTLTILYAHTHTHTHIHMHKDTPMINALTAIHSNNVKPLTVGKTNNILFTYTGHQTRIWGATCQFSQSDRLQIPLTLQDLTIILLHILTYHQKHSDSSTWVKMMTSSQHHLD